MTPSSPAAAAPRVSRAPLSPTPSWSVPETERLIALWNDGRTAAQVAVTLGKSVRAVESKVRKLRVAGHRLSGRRQAVPRITRVVTRRCLHCGHPFPSEHIGNRICRDCLDDGPFRGLVG